MHAMKIAVMGAGAVGAYYGGMLARAGHEVVLVARPAHVQAIRERGLLLQTTTFTEPVRLRADSDAAAVQGASLVLFCVKSTDTVEAGGLMAPHLTPGAVVWSLQNGVDNAERLREKLPGHEVHPAVVYVATEMAGAGHVRHHGRGELVIGPEAASHAGIVQAFSQAGVPLEVSGNVAGALWAKLVLNCAYNALSALSRLPYGRLAQGAGVRAAMRDVVEECLAVARADGIEIPGDPWAAVERIAITMPQQFSSTAQDLMRGKPSEIDFINGHVVRRGEALDVPVPANRLLHTLVKLVESAPAA
jgi:2-dehydropantoate 2-reductase